MRIKIRNVVTVNWWEYLGSGKVIPFSIFHAVQSRYLYCFGAPFNNTKSDISIISSINSTKIAGVVIGEYNEKDELYDPFEHRDKKHTNS